MISFDPELPGAANTRGYNTQVGLGLYEGLELVGRLATNDQRCNMFKAGACPQNNIRDFSASLKWSPQIEWLSQNRTKVAIGVTDVGGAASYFKSYYAVASKEVGNSHVSLGLAKSAADYSILKGAFASLAYKPTNWLDLNVQKIGAGTWASAVFKAEIPYTQTTGFVAINKRLAGEALTGKHWAGVGIELPLDSVNSQTKSDLNKRTGPVGGYWLALPLNPDDLKGELKSKGFIFPEVVNERNYLRIIVENTAYAWNTVDALAAALGAIASTNGKVVGQLFELNVTSRGISQAVVTGEASCLKRWLERGDFCKSLAIRSGLQNYELTNSDIEDLKSSKIDFSSWSLRPEIVLSPTLISSIGTEFGSFDMDAGVNINVVLPLWKGATIETNRTTPIGVGTRGFEAGGVFYASRLKPGITRTLIHQLLNIPSINTQARLSAGTAYTTWDGQQIETSTQSGSGRHRLGVISGSFKNQTNSVNQTKNYELLTYRYAYDDELSTTTEVTSGKFWGGDRGWSVGQKFWHGDTALSVYLRRSRSNESSPLVSFAGLQISLPITPRVNKGMTHVAFRGTNQWTYSLESRVFDRENFVTGGYGEVPRIGDSLIQTFNRDRNSTRYLQSSLTRARSALVEFSGQK